MSSEPNQVHQVTLEPVLRQQWGRGKPSMATEKKLRQQSLFCPPSCPQGGNGHTTTHLQSLLGISPLSPLYRKGERSTEQGWDKSCGSPV